MPWIPREEKYFSLLSQLVNKVSHGADLLTKLFDDFPQHTTYASEIKKVELECDKLSMQITDRLNSTFITPIDREDIYLLTKELDGIMNMINEMARLTVIYDVQNSTPAAKELAQILAQTVLELEKAVPKLDGRQGVHDNVLRIKQFEEQGDHASQAALQSLFANEKNPIELIKWLKIYEDMESGIDLCWEVAKLLEAIFVKNS